VRLTCPCRHRPSSPPPVRHRHAPVLLPEILCVPRHQRHVQPIRAGEDDRVGQFDPPRAAQGDGGLGDRLVDLHADEALQEGPRRGLRRGRCADHHLHPGDRADRRPPFGGDRRPRFGDAVQAVDQDAGVEDRAHHSARIRSW